MMKCAKGAQVLDRGVALLGSVDLPLEIEHDFPLLTVFPVVGSVVEDGARVRAWLVTTAKRETLRLLGEARRFVAPTGAGDDEEPDDPLARVPDPGPLQDEQLSALQESDRLRQAVDRLDLQNRVPEVLNIAFTRYVKAADRQALTLSCAAPGMMRPNWSAPMRPMN